MADKLIYEIPSSSVIQKITPVDYNKWLKPLNTQLNEPTYQNSMIFPKVVSQRIRKRKVLKTLATSLIISQLSPSLLKKKFTWVM